MNQRAHVLLHYKQLINDKIDAFQDMIAALSTDASNDAKSSAGDKHETALSMMQLEQERLNTKLSEYIEQKYILDKIDLAAQTTKIALGSLVLVNDLLLFLSTALPKISVGNQNIFGISPQSPLGRELYGNEVGHIFSINKTKYEIRQII